MRRKASIRQFESERSGLSIQLRAKFHLTPATDERGVDPVIARQPAHRLDSCQGRMRLIHIIHAW